MLNKEEIEKAKEKLNKYVDKVNRNKRILEGSEIQTSEAINTLLQYIDQLEEIKGMKEAIELAGMDIKSLLNFKYENKKLKNKIDQLEQENNNEPLDDIYYPDILASPKRNGEHIKFALVEQEYFEELKNTVNKLNKINDEMVGSFYKLYQKIPGTMHKFFENGKPCEYGYDKETNECKEINCKLCIKQYFKEKVEKQ